MTLGFFWVTLCNLDSLLYYYSQIWVQSIHDKGFIELHAWFHLHMWILVFHLSYQGFPQVLSCPWSFHIQLWQELVTRFISHVNTSNCLNTAMAWYREDIWRIYLISSTQIYRRTKWLPITYWQVQYIG